MRLAIFAVAALLASSTFSLADTFIDKVVSKLEDQGFQVTETSNDGNVITVEATRDGKTRELKYDAQTGLLLHDEYDGQDVTSSSLGSEDDVNGTDDDSNDDAYDDGGSDHESGDDSSHDSSDDSSDSGSDSGSDGGDD